MEVVGFFVLAVLALLPVATSTYRRPTQVPCRYRAPLAACLKNFRTVTLNPKIQMLCPQFCCSRPGCIGYTNNANEGCRIYFPPSRRGGKCTWQRSFYPIIRHLIIVRPPTISTTWYHTTSRTSSPRPTSPPLLWTTPPRTTYSHTRAMPTTQPAIVTPVIDTSPTPRLWPSGFTSSPGACYRGFRPFLNRKGTGGIQTNFRTLDDCLLSARYMALPAADWDWAHHTCKLYTTSQDTNRLQVQQNVIHYLFTKCPAGTGPTGITTPVTTPVVTQPTPGPTTPPAIFTFPTRSTPRRTPPFTPPLRTTPLTTGLTTEQTSQATTEMMTGSSEYVTGTTMSAGIGSTEEVSTVETMTTTTGKAATGSAGTATTVTVEITTVGVTTDGITEGTTTVVSSGTSGGAALTTQTEGFTSGSATDSVTGTTASITVGVTEVVTATDFTTEGTTEGVTAGATEATTEGVTSAQETTVSGVTAGETTTGTAETGTPAAATTAGVTGSDADSDSASNENVTGMTTP